MQAMLVSIYRFYTKFVLRRAVRLGLARFYPFKVVKDYILSQRSDFVEIQGHGMFVDPEDSLGLSIYRVWEPLETRLVSEAIEKDDVVLDIGANIGYYTLIFARLVGNGGRVFAFEPDPDNFALLQRNVELNGYQNVVLVQKAVARQTGKIRLYLSNESSADHNIYDRHNGRKSIEVEAIRLDDYFKDYDRKVNFVKMDVEGAEWEALQGMSHLLTRNASVRLLTEFWPALLHRYGIDPKGYLSSLRDFGFMFYNVNKYTNRIEPIDSAALLQLYTPENGKQTNLLCTRSQHAV